MVAGRDLNRMDGERRRYRSQVVGYCWQRSALNLAGELTARQNVEVAMLAGGRRNVGARSRELLDRMGVVHVAHRLPLELTGEEAQRLALAVALANGPRLLLADEPTAELDGPSAERLLADLGAHLRETRTGAVLVTHDRHVERHVDRVIRIRDGRTSTETRRADSADGATELVIMDRAGRLQVPAEYVERLGLGDRVRLVREADHVRIFPAGDESA